MNNYRIYLLKKISEDADNLTKEVSSEQPSFDVESYAYELAQSSNYQTYRKNNDIIINLIDSEVRSVSYNLNLVTSNYSGTPIVDGSKESQLLENLFSKLDEAINLINFNEITTQNIDAKIQERQYEDQEIIDYLKTVNNKEDVESNEDLKLNLNNLIKFKKEFISYFRKIEQIFLKYSYYLNQIHKLLAELKDAGCSLATNQGIKLLEKIKDFKNNINVYISKIDEMYPYDPEPVEQDILLKFSKFKEYNYPLKINIIHQIIPAIYPLGLSEDYVENLTSYLNSISTNFKINKNLLHVFHKKYNLEKFSISDFKKIASGDVNFLIAVCGNDKDIVEALRNTQEHRAEVLSSLTLDRDLIKEEIDPDIVEKKLILNLISYQSSRSKEESIKKLYKTIYRYVDNYFGDLNCFVLCDYLKNNNEFNLFIQFYHQNIKPIDLGMLINGYLLKFNPLFDSLKSHGFSVKDFNLLLASIKKLNIKSDEKIISLLKRSKVVNRIFHNNSYDLPAIDDENYQFEYDDYISDLYLSILKSKWDLDQDLVNKFINVALNAEIDEVLRPERFAFRAYEEVLEQEQNEIKSILVDFNINFDQFRHDLMEIRGIVARSAPIPFSFKEKIYQVDNVINIILTRKLISEHIDKVKKKDYKLFNLNYNLENGLRFEVLPDKSLEHFTVGAATQCCQAPGKAGKEAMIDSFINPLAGVLTLKKGNKIIAQSYFHYVPQDNGYILDNVESNDSLVKKYNLNLNNLYANLAQKLKQDWDVKYFICGKTYNKLSDSNFGSGEMEEDPRSFDVDDPYSDFDERDYLNLSSPTFEISPIKINKTAATKLNKIIKMATVFNQLSDIFVLNNYAIKRSNK